MLVYAVETAKKSKLFDEVIVSTEDDEIKKIASEAGAAVMHRSDDLATDQSSVDQVCVDVMKQLADQNKKPNSFCVIYPTAAFLESEDLIGSEKKLDQSDVVMGVSAYPIHPYKALEEKDGRLKPVFPVENNRKSQTYPHWVASNGTFYWCKTAPFLDKPDFYPDKLSGYELPLDRSVDIDTPEDYAWAQHLMTIKTGKKSC